jgi:hypothetical protein
MVSVEIDSVDKNINQATYFYYGIWSMVHILYIVAFFGIVSVDKSYIHSLNVLIQVFIVLFLLYRFNPLRKNIKLTEADSTIAFGSAILLATNLIGVELARWINPFVADIKNTVYHYITRLTST